MIQVCKQCAVQIPRDDSCFYCNECLGYIRSHKAADRRMLTIKTNQRVFNEIRLILAGFSRLGPSIGAAYWYRLSNPLIDFDLYDPESQDLIIRLIRLGPDIAEQVMTAVSTFYKSNLNAG